MTVRLNTAPQLSDQRPLSGPLLVWASAPDGAASIHVQTTHAAIVVHVSLFIVSSSAL
jgi:hypothetical protein